MYDFILRNTPKIADSFVFETIESDGGLDTYKVFARDKKIVVCGNNNVAKAMGYYRYLRDYCGVMLSGGNYDISYIKTAPLPEGEIIYTVPQKIRMAMTYERFAAEAESWGVDRWEKEIDFMAMIGVNTPLALTGSDGVLYKTLMELRIKEENALSFISGSSFWPRQLTGNIFGYLPMNSPDYFAKKIEIGRFVTQREKALDMNPVHQGYISSVPFTFRKHYSKADLIKLPVWNSFPPSMTLSPDDDIHIKVLNGLFLQKQRELLGEVHNYIFEPLYDVDFKGYTSFVDEASQMYMSFIKEIDSEAKWFVHSSSLYSLDKKIDGMVIIDESGESFASHGGFGSNSFIIGLRGNLNGRTVICGDAETLAENQYIKSKESYPNLEGTGLFFDSDSNNPLFYSLAAEVLTANKSIDMSDYLKRFSLGRYKTDKYTGFLSKLVKTCYCKGSKLNQASALCARPCTKIDHTAVGDTFDRPYDNKDLLALVKEALDNDAVKNEAMRLDLQDLVRQTLSNVLRPIYLQATECFFRVEAAAYEKTSNAFIEIAQDIDRLLKTVEQTNLYHHLDFARQLGDTKEVRQNLEVNFLMYHTIYGPMKNPLIFDDSWREWGGMTADFYLKRWYIYFRMLASYFGKPKKLKDISKHQPLGRNAFAQTLLSKRLEYMENEWIRDYIPRPTGIGEEDTLEVIKELIDKYESVINEF